MLRDGGLVLSSVESKARSLRCPSPTVWGVSLSRILFVLVFVSFSAFAASHGDEPKAGGGGGAPVCPAEDDVPFYKIGERSDVLDAVVRKINAVFTKKQAEDKKKPVAVLESESILSPEVVKELIAKRVSFKEFSEIVARWNQASGRKAEVFPRDKEAYKKLLKDSFESIYKDEIREHKELKADRAKLAEWKAKQLDALRRLNSALDADDRKAALEELSKLGDQIRAIEKKIDDRAKKEFDAELRKQLSGHLERLRLEMGRGPGPAHNKNNNKNDKDDKDDRDDRDDRKENPSGGGGGRGGDGGRGAGPGSGTGGRSDPFDFPSIPSPQK